MIDAPITQTGTSVQIQGDALPLMYRATLALIARRQRDGVAAQPLLQEARAVFYRACTSPARDTKMRRRHYPGQAVLVRTAVTGSASPKRLPFSV
jgi:hypothetical protein